MNMGSALQKQNDDVRAEGSVQKAQESQASLNCYEKDSISSKGHLRMSSQYTSGRRLARTTTNSCSPEGGEAYQEFVSNVSAFLGPATFQDSPRVFPVKGG